MNRLRSNVIGVLVLFLHGFSASAAKPTQPIPHEIVGPLTAVSVSSMIFSQAKGSSKECSSVPEENPEIGCELHLSIPDPSWASLKYCGFEKGKQEPQIKYCYYDVKSGTGLQPVMSYLVPMLGKKFKKRKSFEYDSDVFSIDWLRKNIEVSVVFDESEKRKYTMPRRVWFNIIRHRSQNK